MTLTIELTPELERVIESEAERRGVAAETLVGEVLGVWATEKVNAAPNDASLTSRQRAAREGYGKFAGRGRTVDDFLRERHEETDLELQAIKRRLEKGNPGN